jgi:hypothetical protein
LRCWYTTSSSKLKVCSKSNAEWQAKLLSRVQEGTGQQEMALQSVPVCTVASSMQAGPWWAVVEACVAF